MTINPKTLPDHYLRSPLALAHFIATLAFGFFLLTGSLTVAETKDAAHSTHNPNSVDSALKALKDGNARFAAGQATNPRRDKEVLAKLAKDGQTPLAAILTCSDSRVKEDNIFDQGFGDIFVIKVVGAIPGVNEVGSLEYAVEHLGVPVVVVLAHTQCGAVTAAVSGAKEPGALGEALANLNPVVKAVEGLDQGARLDAAIKMSASMFREKLSMVSPVIAKAVKEGRLKVVSAVFDISTGVVAFNE
jgi:carbonic anhydrase